ncbi:unnamed protein product, partial [Amoebophrya sp. A25]|eukprot:GSA25T00008038001.1
MEYYRKHLSGGNSWWLHAKPLIELDASGLGDMKDHLLSNANSKYLAFEQNELTRSHFKWLNLTVAADVVQEHLDRINSVEDALLPPPERDDPDVVYRTRLLD